ncbi:hypothetical protein EDB84DRAFT_1441391 [Lactarius hengduanensis]|nr:hypothetical protein EDB84DRAFT_1441391 [Lactarius hengduanensis]
MPLRAPTQANMWTACSRSIDKTGVEKLQERNLGAIVGAHLSGQGKDNQFVKTPGCVPYCNPTRVLKQKIVNFVEKDIRAAADHEASTVVHTESYGLVRKKTTSVLSPTPRVCLGVLKAIAFLTVYGSGKVNTGKYGFKYGLLFFIFGWHANYIDAEGRPLTFGSQVIRVRCGKETNFRIFLAANKNCAKIFDTAYDHAAQRSCVPALSQLYPLSRRSDGWGGFKGGVALARRDTSLGNLACDRQRVRGATTFRFLWDVMLSPQLICTEQNIIYTGRSETNIRTITSPELQIAGEIMNSKRSTTPLLKQIFGMDAIIAQLYGPSFNVRRKWDTNESEESRRINFRSLKNVWEVREEEDYGNDSQMWSYGTRHM